MTTCRKLMFSKGDPFMSLNIKKHALTIIYITFVILLLLLLAVFILNRFGTSYEKLSSTDQQILTEYDAYYKANMENEIWENYDLENKTIVAINEYSGSAYVINPKNDINSLFAAKIITPANSSLRVYRVSAITPQILSMRFFNLGNFSTIGKKYSIFDNDVYYIKYNTKDSIDASYSAQHFITFLSHEAFHYYMQNNWSDGSRFSGELSETDIELIDSEYKLLDKVQVELAKKTPSKETLLSYANDYVTLIEHRAKANSQYLESELSMETVEGTAQYVGIKASQIVGYDYGTMYFDNAKNVSFSEVIPMLRTGGIESSFLANRMPYETGSLLCEWMDALEFNQWKKRLNSQTKENPITLFAVLRYFITEIN